MSLTINWRQADFNQGYGIIGKFGSLENVGKLNTASPSQADSGLRAANTVKAAERAIENPQISKEDFLLLLNDNLRRLGKTDNEGNSKDVRPLVDQFSSFIDMLEETYSKEVADMAMSVIAQDINKYGASEKIVSNAINNALNEIGNFGLKTNFEAEEKFYAKLNTGIPEFMLHGYSLEEIVNRREAGESFWDMAAADMAAAEEKEAGLAKALSDFYFNDKSDAKYTLTTIKKFEGAGRLVTGQWLRPHSDEPEFMDGYYSELAEEYHANTYPGIDGSFDNASVVYGEEAYDPIDRAKGETHSYLKDEWFAAGLQAAALAKAKPDMKPLERAIFLQNTTKTIVNGDIESELSDEMQKKVALFSQLKEQEKVTAAALRQAWADSGITSQIIEPGMLTDEINSASRQNSEIVSQLWSLSSEVSNMIRFMGIDIRQMLEKYANEGASQPAALSTYA